MSRIVYHRTRLPLGPSLGLALTAVLAAWAWRATLPVMPAESAAPAVPVPGPVPTPTPTPLRTAAGANPVAAPQAARQPMVSRAVAPAAIVAPVQAQQLTTARLASARAFLDEVRVAPAPRGGFVVVAVEPDSRWERMGLRPGDVVYSLDTPAMAAIDDTSMVALTQQTTLELDVYRAGTLLRLQLPLNRDEAPGHDAGRTPS